MRKNKIVITGGAGFIGSEFVRQLVKQGVSPIVIDNLSYAGCLYRLHEVKGRYKFYKADIADNKRIEAIWKKERPQAIINFAAETHVDRSIACARPFITTNVLGTQVLLDACRKYPVRRFVHISTDEVYGDIVKGKFTETSALKPSSPYAAAKAAADLLIQSYVRTYRFPAVIVRPCNNYGPWQFPEKLIPVTIRNVMHNHKTPVYAQGKNVREWLCVSDCARAIRMVLEQGQDGQVYNLGSGQEVKNIDLVRKIITILGRDNSLIQFVQDRPGHDIRYSLDSHKIRTCLGWKPELTFNQGLLLTVAWNRKNQGWLEKKYLANKGA